MPVRKRRQKDPIDGFRQHGFVDAFEDGDQSVGDCPFCSHEEHFFVNKENQMWDCKHCGMSGNFYSFLREVCKVNEATFRGDFALQKRLATNRGLPVGAFKGTGIGWDGTQYTIPIYTERGTISDVRRYRVGLNTRSTANCKSYLFGAETIPDSDRKAKVWLCEGEWDAVALRWLLASQKRGDVVLAVPGADVLKKDWVQLFDDRDVLVCYDNDEAGERGAGKVHEVLGSVIRSMKFIHWPSGFPEKGDLRDFIKIKAVKEKDPKACLSSLQKLLRDVPHQPGPNEELEDVKPSVKRITRKVSHKDVWKAFSTWLRMENDNALAVLFGSMLANQLHGDPLWIFLVAPPGGMKSALLMALTDCQEAYFVSSLTQHALASGAQLMGNKDPSLIPKLDGKVLIIKDFTTTLQMHPTARDEVFGQLRDVYDGKFDKIFGNGISRRYNSSFGIVAGVTPNIDAFASLNLGLGERFLKYRLDDAAIDEYERIQMAISNINQETRMYDELRPIAETFLKQHAVDEDKDLPQLPPAVCKKIIALAMLVSRMRGVVHRDRYEKGLVHAKASHEVGTRMAKQLTKLAYGLCMYYDETEVSKHVYSLVSQIAIDSVPDKVSEVLKSVAKGTPHKDDSLTTREVFVGSEKLTLSTINRTLQDLAMLGLVRQLGGRTKHTWQLGKNIRKFIIDSEVWRDI